MVYLNDVPDSQEETAKKEKAAHTVFYRNPRQADNRGVYESVSFRPVEGRALIFPIDSALHAAKPVAPDQGVKYITACEITLMQTPVSQSSRIRGTKN